ncbi:N-acetylmuramoyl-L-alanine amidase [Gaiella occulta]|uniref:N-acetylmuramoyl-L-alanine amidase n=1 Tax=Gaiella occulta TaxID=1002870 RepID=A0A7M2YYR6_9ACTN|nr:N-acetylmuramoyl-L-alanine amidase [Gaiella occulta]
MPYAFVESPNVTRAERRRIDVVVIHTMEIGERDGAAAACARWFADPAAQVSAHYCVDAGTVIQCVRERDIAWHARGGNGNSVGIELAGFAGQGADGWSDPYSQAVLERAAAVAAGVCARHGIPMRRLRGADLRARRRGIGGHADVSDAFGKSDHRDPGPDFPWQRFLRLVRASARGGDVVERAAQA